MSPRLIDLTGQRFGHWTVVAIHPERRRYGRARQAVAVLWCCVCDCDTQRLVHGNNLRAGYSKSCGCLSRETTRKRSTKHGHARRGQHTRAYNTWRSLKQRCLNPNNPNYRDYGGRGIGVHEAWCRDYPTYYAETGERPLGKSFDRIDNDGNYEPGNWRWATASEQALNRRPPKRKRRRAKLADINAYAAALARAASGEARRAP